MYFLAKALQIRSEQKNEIHWLSTELRQKTGTSHKPHFTLDIKSKSKTIEIIHYTWNTKELTKCEEIVSTL